MKTLKTPISTKDILELKVGDIVKVNGTIFTARDQAHKKIIKEGPPFDLKGSVIFHAGPIVKNNENFSLVAIGPTTSARMNPFGPKLIRMGVKAIIGKGGMDKNTKKALIKNKAVYLAAVGGCAAMYADKVKKIKSVKWLELGIPEAIWELEVKDFGPLIVAMDSHGGNLYEDVEKKIRHFRDKIRGNDRYTRPHKT